MIVMVLSACSSAATIEAPVVEEPAAEAVEVEEPTQAPEPEPVEDVEEPAEPEVVEPASEEMLDKPFGEFLGSMVKYNTIGVDTLNEQITHGNTPFLLDVRTESEVEENGRIEGAVLIPLVELGDNFDKFPSFDTSSVSYCGSDWRCTIARTGLGTLGYYENLLALKDNSFGGWVEAGYPVVEGLPPDAEVLIAIKPDSSLALTITEMFSRVPDGYGFVTADNLAAALAEKPDLILIDVRT